MDHGHRWRGWERFRNPEPSPRPREESGALFLHKKPRFCRPYHGLIPVKHCLS